MTKQAPFRSSAGGSAGGRATRMIPSPASRRPKRRNRLHTSLLHPLFRSLCRQGTGRYDGPHLGAALLLPSLSSSVEQRLISQPAGRERELWRGPHRKGAAGVGEVSHAAQATGA